ncbi:S9 family peptidase [Halorubellus salinus]|uniref:S9 family peptidase n=1 Tax=Halorubellus salinus TaxID=755309 RepID=UPI001D078A1B|nr:S9 family peptidase [Halorubellus salinus]
MSYDIERYLNVRSASGASFGPEGDRLSFMMDTTGTSQVWTVDEPGSWPVQRTFYEERVTFASWSPEHDELAFGMDEGGNERAQLYRLSGDGSEVVNLTGRPDAKHRWGGWSHDGERFAFTSNRRDESVFDVYVQGRDETGNDAELVHEGSGWLTPAGWSPSDDRLLVHEAYSNVDQDVYVLDLETGEFECITPHDDEIRFHSPSFGPEDDAVYCCTGDGSDTLYLARIDLETLEREVVEDGGEWNVDGVSIDHESGRFAFSRNVDGYTDLTVAEFTGETEYDAFPSPDLPGGIAGGVSWGPDADRYAITATGAAVNTNVYVVETETGDTERWTYAATAGIPEDSFREPELVHVESFDGVDVPGFLTLPEDAADGEGAAGDGDTPVVVSIHGGPESQRRPSFNPVKQYFLNRGYAYFEPNVRGSTGYGETYTRLDDVEKRMDSVADVKACVEWLHDHPAVDPDRIACMGGSYGGFMVLACMTEYPDLWAAGVDVVGIANFVSFLENTGEWRRKLREAEYGSLEHDREFLESISPINNVEKIAAPLFVLHGENDPRVPVGEAEQIVEEAREQGVPVRKLVFDDEGHGFSKLENRVEAYSAVAEFLDEHV